MNVVYIDRDVEMVNTILKAVKFALLYPRFEQSHYSYNCQILVHRWYSETQTYKHTRARARL